MIEAGAYKTYITDEGIIFYTARQKNCTLVRFAITYKLRSSMPIFRKLSVLVTKRCKKIYLCCPSIFYRTKFNKRVKIVLRTELKL